MYGTYHFYCTTHVGVVESFFTYPHDPLNCYFTRQNGSPLSNCFLMNGS